MENILNFLKAFLSVKEMGRKETKKTPKYHKGMVNIMVVEANKLRPVDKINNTSDPYCKLLIGKEKIRTKIAMNTINPSWKEMVLLNWFEGSNKLVVQVHSGNNIQKLLVKLILLTFPGKEEYLGRVELNLSELCINVTHDIWRNIEDSQGSIHLIMTIIGTEDGISQIADVNDVNLTHKYVRRKS